MVKTNRKNRSNKLSNRVKTQKRSQNRKQTIKRTLRGGKGKPQNNQMYNTPNLNQMSLNNLVNQRQNGKYSYNTSNYQNKVKQQEFMKRQEKYKNSFPDNLKLIPGKVIFTDRISDEIFLSISKENYLSFYENVNTYIKTKNVKNLNITTEYSRILNNCLNNCLNNESNKVDDIKKVIYGFRDLIKNQDLIKDTSSSNLRKILLEYTIHLYNNIKNEFNRPDNIKHCTPIIKHGTHINKRKLAPIAIILNVDEENQIRDMKINNLFAFFSYLLDFLKIEQDDDCNVNINKTITCKCYNKQKKLTGYSMQKNNNIYSVLNKSTKAPYRVNINYNKLVKPNKTNNPYSKLSVNSSQKIPNVTGNESIYSIPFNNSGNQNHVYSTINGETNNNKPSGYFTKLQKNANKTYGNAQDTLAKKTYVRSTNYTKKNNKSTFGRMQTKFLEFFKKNKSPKPAN